MNLTLGHNFCKQLGTAFFCKVHNLAHSTKGLGLRDVNTKYFSKKSLCPGAVSSMKIIEQGSPYNTCNLHICTM
jgi:hypothetical protein